MTDTHLAGIGDLAFHGKDLDGLQSRNFAGLSGLKDLDIAFSSDLTALPEGIFDDLDSSPTALTLDGTGLDELPAGIFDGMGSLTTLVLNGNNLSSLPGGIFDDLAGLKSLALNDNDLTELPADLFAGLSAIEELFLSDNNLSSVPPLTFAGLTYPEIFIRVNGNAVEPNRGPQRRETAGMLDLDVDGRGAGRQPPDGFRGGRPQRGHLFAAVRKAAGGGTPPQ